MKFALLAAALFVWAGAETSFAETQGSGSQGQSSAAPGGAMAEHLVMPEFPKGWSESSTVTGQVEIVEYIPRDQDAKSWKDRITLEVHHESQLPIDVFQRRALSQLRANCDGVIEDKLQTGVNNGYPAAFWRLWCKKNKEGNYGETAYTKAIQGPQVLYVLTRFWRMAPFGDDGPPTLSRQESNDAISFLSSSVLCTDSPPHPCPTAPH